MFSSKEKEMIVSFLFTITRNYKHFRVFCKELNKKNTTKRDKTPQTLTKYTLKLASSLKIAA